MNHVVNLMALAVWAFFPIQKTTGIQTVWNHHCSFPCDGNGKQIFEWDHDNMHEDFVWMVSRTCDIGSSSMIILPSIQTYAILEVSAKCFDSHVLDIK